LRGIFIFQQKRGDSNEKPPTPWHVFLGTLFSDGSSSLFLGCPVPDDGGEEHIPIDKNALKTAISTANAARAGIESDADGSNVPVDKLWVTPAVLSNFNAAIGAAQSVARRICETIKCKINIKRACPAGNSDISVHTDILLPMYTENGDATLVEYNIRIFTAKAKELALRRGRAKIKMRIKNGFLFFPYSVVSFGAVAVKNSSFAIYVLAVIAY
jgi:hypothetical protein